MRLLHVMDHISFATGFEADASGNSDGVPLMKGAEDMFLDDGSRLAEAAGVLFDTLLIDNFALPIAERVEECLNEWKADLVVIGTHGQRGFKRFLMGSDAEQVCGAPRSRSCSSRAPTSPRCRMRTPRRTSAPSGPARGLPLRRQKSGLITSTRRDHEPPCTRIILKAHASISATLQSMRLLLSQHRQK
jgi:hypothetical protein